jgi:sulfite exporter TauE/SafE
MVTVIFCGIGHILSSLVIGLICVSLGMYFMRITNIQVANGTIAAWLMTVLGTVYTIWGIRQSFKNKNQNNIIVNTAENIKQNQQEDVKSNRSKTKHENSAIWFLLIIFILAPNEPLLPLILYPASTNNYFIMVLVSVVFGVMTIAAMLGMTFLGIYGVRLIHFNKFERHIHTIAGLSILLCGLAILLLKL